MERKDEGHWDLPKRAWVIVGYWLVNGSKWLLYRLVLPIAPAAFTILYLLGVTVASLVVALFGDSRPLTSDDSALFSTVGAMIAGMLAIVFFLRTLLIQNAAATQSSGLFDIVARDRWQNTSYWLLALVSLLHIVIAGILVGSPGMLSFMTSAVGVGMVIFTSGFSLYLIFFELSRVYRRINPLHSINLVKSSILRLVSQIGDAAELHTRYIRAKTPRGQPQSDSKRLAASFLLLRPSIAVLSSNLTFLFDYHDKLYQQRENTAARLVLRAIGEIAIKYVEIRRSSFFLVQSSEPFVAESDSQVFFRNLLEPLVSKAKRYMQSGDDDGVIETIGILETLTARATQVGFMGDVQGENPLVEQCRFHLGLVIQYAGRRQNIEGLFQGVKSLGRIGVLTANTGLHLEAQSISADLNSAAFAGVLMRQDVVWTEVLFSFGMLLEAYGTNRPSRHSTSLSFILDYLRLTLNTVFTGIGRSLIGTSNRGYRAFALPFEVATKVIYNLSDRTNRGDGGSNVSPSIVVETCEKYRRFLRKLSEEVKSADSYMVEAAAKSIGQICVLLLGKQSSPEFDGHRDDMQNALNWLVNQLGWFAENAEVIKDKHAFDALVESAAKVGLNAVDIGNAGIAAKAVEVINWLAKAYADKTKEPYYGLTIPRIMKRACFVGILAFKQKQDEPLKLLKEFVAKIDSKAKEQADEVLKASSEIKEIGLNLVESEVGQLYEICTHEKYNPNPLDDSSQCRLFANIECRDIDKFCEEIWGSKASETYKSYRAF